MFLHTERQSLLRNICVATYGPTAALSTKCKECKRGGAGALWRARRKGTGGEEPRLNSTGSTPVLFQLVAPRFEFAADLPVHAGLGQRDPRLGRHLGDDRHVVLGPGHRLASPLLERTVRTARHEERAAQGFDIGAVVLREGESFVIGDQARPPDQIVRGLRDLRRADAAGMP